MCIMLASVRFTGVAFAAIALLGPIVCAGSRSWINVSHSDIILTSRVDGSVVYSTRSCVQPGETIVTQQAPGWENSSSVVTAISLSECYIQNIETSTLSVVNVANIKSLNLRSNGIRNLMYSEKSLIGSLTALESLDIRENQLNFIHSQLLENCSTLLSINFANNLITMIDVGAFNWLENLFYLDLSNNLLASLDHATFALTAGLRWLFLSSNELVNISQNLFTGVEQLDELWLDNNEIHSLPDMLLVGTSNLSLLSLQGNPIEKFPQGFFDNNLRLKRLYANRMNLLSIRKNMLENLRELIHVRLDDNPIECESILDPSTSNWSMTVSCTSCNNNAIWLLENETSGLQECDVFRLSMSAIQEAERIYAILNRTYFVNETVVAPGFSSSREELFVNYAQNDAQSIVFGVHFKPPNVKPGENVFISSDTGQVSITPSATGIFSATIEAQDARGARVEILDWTIRVEKRPAFRIVDAVQDGTSRAAACIDEVAAVQAWASEQSYIIGKTTVVPGFNCSQRDMFVNYADNNTVAIEYQVRFWENNKLSNPPGEDVFINPATSKISLTPQILGTFRAGVYASDARRIEVLVYNWSFSVSQQSPENPSSDSDLISPTAYGIIGASVAFVMLCAFVLWKWMSAIERRKANMPANWTEEIEKMVENGSIPTPSPDTALSVLKTPTEVQRSRITLIKQIGGGQFGDVMKATIKLKEHGDPFLVAAKTVRDGIASPQARADLLAEAAIMAQVSEHRNIVSLIGVCTAGSPLILVVSFCEHGSLEDVLYTEERQFPLSVKIRMSLEISCGMDHLTKLEFVHRDLAARNVLLATGMVCKIADFGLSRKGSVSNASNSHKKGNRDIYYRSQTGMFALRWAAPEVLQELIFSASSDVWAFGVTVGEIFSNCDEPYGDVDNEAVVQMIMSGKGPLLSDSCPPAVADIVNPCFAQDPTTRPDFSKLTIQLQAVLGEHVFTDGGSDNSSNTRAVEYVTGEVMASNVAYGLSDMKSENEPPTPLSQNSGYIESQSIGSSVPDKKPVYELARPEDLDTTDTDRFEENNGMIQNPLHRIRGLTLSGESQQES